MVRELKILQLVMARPKEENYCCGQLIPRAMCHPGGWCPSYRQTQIRGPCSPVQNHLPDRKVTPHLATRGRAGLQMDKRAAAPCVGRGLHPPGSGEAGASIRELNVLPSVYLLGAAVLLPQPLVAPPPGWSLANTLLSWPHF